MGAFRALALSSLFVSLVGVLDGCSACGRVAAVPEPDDAGSDEDSGDGPGVAVDSGTMRAPDATVVDAGESRDGAADVDASAAMDADADAADDASDAADAAATTDAAPSSGTLDTTFAGKGYVTRTATAGGTAGDQAFGVTIDAERRIVGAGRSHNLAADYVATVWRILETGDFDPAFAANGAWWLDGGTGQSFGQGVTVDSQNRPIAAGYAPPATTLWRLDAAGVLDLGFGGQGSVSPPATPGVAEAATVDSSGNVVAAGESLGEMVVWSYTNDGSPNLQFNTTGYVQVPGTLDGSPSNDHGLALAIDASGRIVVAGWTSDAQALSHATLWRLTREGALDASFGVGGQAVFSGIAGGAVQYGTDVATSVAIDGQGRILFAGATSSVLPADRAYVGRLASDGTLDTSFGSAGFVLLVGPAGVPSADHTFAAGVRLDSQGRVVLGGHVSSASAGGFVAAWRLSSAGSIDTSFGDQGIFTMTGTAGPGAMGLDYARALAVDAKDRAVLAGYTLNAAARTEVAFWRLTP